MVLGAAQRLHALAILRTGLVDVHGDKEAVDAILAHPDIKRGLLRRLDADREDTSTKPARRTASACRRWAAPRTTRWSCPMPTSTSPPTPLIGAAYGSAGERCMAISAVVAVGDAGDPLVAS